MYLRRCVLYLPLQVLIKVEPLPASHKAAAGSLNCGLASLLLSTGLGVLLLLLALVYWMASEHIAFCGVSFSAISVGGFFGLALTVILPGEFLAFVLGIAGLIQARGSKYFSVCGILFSVTVMLFLCMGLCISCSLIECFD